MKTITYPLLALSAALLLACGKAPEAPASTSTTAAAAAPAKLSQYTPEQFYATKSYIGNDINAAGDAMLVASDETGVFNLYKVSMNGKSWQTLTQSTTDAMMPVSWFPQDDRVLYSADQGGNELHHLYVREIDGAVKDLTPGDKLKAMFVDWAADGSFYVLTNERDAKFFDLYKYDGKTYQRSLVYQNDAGYDVAGISPDGRYLAAIKSRTNADNNLHLIDISAEKPTETLVTPHQGNINHQVYSFSRDSKTLIFGTDEQSEFSQAMAFDIASGKATLFSKADWDIMYIGFSKDNKFRVEGVNADAATKVTIVDLSLIHI